MNRFWDLPEDVDIMEAFNQFEKEQMQADIEAFALENDISVEVVAELLSEYVFTQRISDDGIRKSLQEYKLGLLKLTKLTKNIRVFLTDTYNKYKAEGQT